ncbi:MAG: hypothetical protein AAFP70_07550 [Calditrichota bacterium]
MIQKINPVLQKVYSLLLSEKTRERGERIIIGVAILSFVLHLLLIILNDYGFLSFAKPGKLLNSTIAAIYTPFSFILIYEVYLLVYYLPRSITTYIGKQYEIITLIVIRRLFKDLGNLELTPDWFRVQNDLQFTYDLVTTIVLFLLIYLFNRLNQRRNSTAVKEEALKDGVAVFIRQKKAIAVLLVPTLLILAVYSFGNWIYDVFAGASLSVTLKDINSIFFDEFFSLLILTDVLLLLLSLLHIDKFNTVIRNSGFIISTILLRISFSVSGLLNVALIVTAVAFGVIMLAIHNLYESLDNSEPVS